MKKNTDSIRYAQLFILCLCIGLLIACGEKKTEYKYTYTLLTDHFPYLDHRMETDHLKLTRKDMERKKYNLQGFNTIQYLLPRTWAAGNANNISQVTFFLSHLEAKTLSFRCTPYIPEATPSLSAIISINGNVIKEIQFTDKGTYSVPIPVEHLTFGSNHFAFKWSCPIPGTAPGKNVPAVGFSFFKLTATTQRANNRNGIRADSRVQLKSGGPAPGIAIPVGGMVEYYMNIPENTALCFQFASQMRALPQTTFHVGVYDEKGAIIIETYKGSQLNDSGKEYVLPVPKPTNRSVRIVFANDAQNPPGYTVSLVNPQIRTQTAIRPPAFSVMENETGKTNTGTQTQTPKRPHIFIYLIDTLRADHMSCYGYWRQTTPNIDRFAEEGVLFSRCFATASWTKPAVASVLTGLYPGNHGAENRDDKLPLNVETLAEILKKEGYSTIHITPNVNASNEVNTSQGADHYRFAIGGKYGGDFYRTSEYVNMEFRDIIENTPGITDKPIYAFIHTVDPHDPYTPHPPFMKFAANDAERQAAELGQAENIRIRLQQNKGLSPNDLEYIKGLYDCEILHNDHYFNEFTAYLKEKGLYRNAVIILVADHGEQFMEHGGLFHGHSIHNEEVHVPLIIKFPNGEYGGQRSPLTVSQVDILPTITDYLNIDHATPITAVDPNANGSAKSVDGISILKLLKQPNFQRYVFIKEKLSSRERQSYFTGAVNSADLNKTIVTFEDPLFINAVDYKAYNLETDFNETVNLLAGKGIFTLRSVKFVSDCFLVRMQFGLRSSETLDYRKMDPEKVEQLKALGYL